jgi:microcystin degradation protein MlrC
VALKSSQHFRAGFEPVAARIITADSPGLTTLDLTAFPYRRLTRPVWPLDGGTAFEP